MAFAYNIIAIPLASMGYLNPIFVALTMAFSDIVVVGNSIRLKYKHRRNVEKEGFTSSKWYPNKEELCWESLLESTFSLCKKHSIIK